MNAFTDMISSQKISRRSFLVSSGGFSAAVAFGDVSDALAQGARAFDPNVWVSIAPNGIVTIVAPAAEMGQGVMTAMPALIAEDMDADWRRVRVIQAPSDAQKYGNPAFGGGQVTGASRTTQGYYEKLRIVGAQTRKVLLANAAEQLKVPISELTTEPGMVVHARSGRKISYGDLAKTAKVPNPLPAATAADLKPLAQCRYVGKDVPRVDIPLKVNGTAKFGIDTQLPNMLYGTILRAPVQGEKPERIDDAAAKAVRGVVQIVPLPYGVGVVADSYAAARKGREALKVTWSNSAKARAYTSDKVMDEFRTAARDMSKTGVSIISHGNAAAAISGAARTISLDYLSEHVAHACMEPMNATAVVNGDRVEIWSPTQAPTLAQAFGARMAGTTPDKVKVNTTLLGGGFGRRIEIDFSLDAVLLARTVQGRPVKVIWTREDDIQYDKFRPLNAQHVQVGLDGGGKIVGWRHRIVADSIFARANPPVYQNSGGKDDAVHDGVEVKYTLPTHSVEYLRQDRGVDVGFWRAVGPGYTKFAVECAIDEIAAARRMDPVALRLELLTDPRAQAVVRTVARMAEWDRKREGRGLGIAYSDFWNTHCAQVAEVSVDQRSGEIRVHNVWCTVDPGIAVQPKNVEAQVESSIIYGISQALYEQITLKDGVVQESNFHDYRLLRMSEAPQIHVGVMPTWTDKPGGIGEVALPPIGPAIANAVAQLTGGKRLRHFPFTPDRVKQALASA